MKQFQGSQRVIMYVVLWIVTACFLSISSAFLQESRTSKFCRRNVGGGEPFNRDQMQQWLKSEDNRSTIEKPASDTNSFGSITTRIYMIGPILDDEECGLSSVTQEACCQSLAHGILCPETVFQMETATKGGRSNRAIAAFLDRYLRYGPMSCIELLSDPEILPHLTTAMRGLA